MDSAGSGPLRAAAAVVVALGAGLAATAWAAPEPRAGAGPLPGGVASRSAATDQVVDNVFLWAERSTLQRLGSAEELLKQGRYDEAVRHLGAILEAPEDYFVPTEGNKLVYRSLKGEALRLIWPMPGKVRESYQLQYGARARQKLGEAIAAGSASGLAEVSWRFFHTQAGYQATMLLGLEELDHGRPLAGALVLRRLREASPEADRFEPMLSLALAACWLQAGMPEKANQTLTALKQRRSSPTVSIAGREAPLPGAGVQPADWLRSLLGPPWPLGPAEADGWTMFRGGPTRNVPSAASAPLLNMRWRVPTTDDPLLEELLRMRLQVDRDQGISDLPGLHPLAVDGVVLMRTSRTLLAVDFLTGKRLWEIPVDDHWEGLLGGIAGESALPQAPQFAEGLRQRLFEDATYGTLSSDGRCVFAIEDLGLGTGMPYARHVIVHGRRQPDSTEPKPYNRLTAHSVRTGKLKWHVGGPTDRFALRQAEVFFLGAPLPLMGRLYVLAEVKGEIRLMALDAETGDLLWSQQLAVTEPNDPLRRLTGVSPSYADGILVCPTSSGAIVAVELATRSLLWGYYYGRTPESLRSANALAMRFGPVRLAESFDHWVDASVTLADGCVLVSPTESDRLYCLNLIDGSLKWELPRQHDLYLACVDQGKVVLVGRRQIRAVSLSDGSPAWEGRTVTLPEGTVPSGRGFLADHSYYVPLSTAEVMAVDLNQGRSVRISKSREGTVPGNLICYRGRVISQGIDGAECYYHLEALRSEVDRRLAARPDDAEALALRGEILADEGKRAEAVACFRRSLALAPDPRTRQLLRDALLDGLRHEFAAHQDDADEIERLIDDPQQRLTYLQLLAAGLQQSGQWRAALESYRKMIQLDQERRGLEVPAGPVVVRRDRWIQTQLAALRRQAAPELAAELDRFVADQCQSAVKAGTAEALRRCLDYFGSHPAADPARGLLIQRAANAGRFLEAELLLWRQQHADDPAQAAAALAQLASLLREARRPEDAALVYARLADEFANVVCSEGKTGRQLVDALPDDDPVRRRLAGGGRWPLGKVEVSNRPTERTRTQTFAQLSLPCREGQTPFFVETTVQSNQQNRTIQARDGLGSVRWQVPLADPGRPHSLGFNHGATCVCFCGHLLVLSMDFKVLAIDTLGQGSAASPRILWSQELAEPGLGALRLPQLHLQPPNLPLGFNRLQLVLPDRGAISVLGPVSDGLVCFQRFRDCVAVDPLDGETLWVRHDVPPGSTLFGDDALVLVVPPDQTEALVLSAADGTLLGRRNVPPADQRLATLGRQILVWRNTGGRCVLERFDPWEQRQVWSPRKFEAEARVSLVGDQALGVFERSGRFVLLSLCDGRAIVDTQLSREPLLSDICVLASGPEYILVVGRQITRRTLAQPIQQMPGAASRQVLNGLAYAFDRQGKPLWPAAAKIENQCLPLDQPGRLPVLTFACLEYQQSAKDSQRYVSSVMCIDKRTGRVVLREKLPYPTSLFELVGRPEEPAVELRLQQTTITMTFTDKPWPPEAESGGALQKQGAPPAWRSKTLEAVWRSVQSAAAAEVFGRGQKQKPPNPPLVPAPVPVPRAPDGH